MKTNINFRSISLRHFLVSTVIPIMVLFLALSWHDTRQFFSFTQDVYNGALETGAGTLTASFAELESISFTPYLYKDISQTMLYMNNGFLRPGTDAPEYLEIDRLESDYTLLFTKLLHSARQNVLSISFYPFDEGLGRCFRISRSSAGLSCISVDPQDVYQLYQYTVENEPVFLTLDNDTSPAPVFSLLRTIKDYDCQRELGVLRIDARSDVLGAALDDIVSAENGYISLLDTYGNLVYRTSLAKDRTSYNNQTCSVGNSGWTLQLSIENRTFRLSNYTSVLIIFLVTLLAYLSALILYRARSARTVSSIDSILFAIQQLQQGNLRHHCEVSDDKELNTIAQALNETGSKLDTLIRTEAEISAARYRAEYLALQSQINPHFLSNILNGFIALNRMGERQLLEKSILNLTRLFRYICSNSDTATVTQEADFVVQYLELQKMRFEDRISYEVTIAQQAGPLCIPKLIVQPLVENCIAHGMRSDDSILHIQLSASVYNEDGHNELILQITDDGIGFDGHVNHTRVGLDNVSKRLSFFHPQARLCIDSKPEIGTTVRLIVPVTPKERL